MAPVSSFPSEVLGVLDLCVYLKTLCSYDTFPHPYLHRRSCSEDYENAGVLLMGNLVNKLQILHCDWNTAT